MSQSPEPYGGAIETNATLLDYASARTGRPLRPANRQPASGIVALVAMLGQYPWFAVVMVMAWADRGPTGTGPTPAGMTAYSLEALVPSFTAAILAGRSVWLAGIGRRNVAGVIALTLLAIELVLIALIGPQPLTALRLRHNQPLLWTGPRRVRLLFYSWGPAPRVALPATERLCWRSRRRPLLNRLGWPSSGLPAAGDQGLQFGLVLRPFWRPAGAGRPGRSGPGHGRRRRPSWP